MKYFTKISNTITTSNKPKVVVTPNSQVSLKTKTTPKTRLSKTKNKVPELKMNVGQNTTVGVPGKASIETYK